MKAIKEFLSNPIMLLILLLNLIFIVIYSVTLYLPVIAFVFAFNFSLFLNTLMMIDLDKMYKKLREVN